MRSLLLSAVVVASLQSSAVSAQPVILLDCPHVSFFTPACAEVVAEEPTSPASPVSRPPEPLFPPGTIAPDTPPLMLAYMNDPTDENGLRYLEWQERKVARMLEAQAKLSRLAQSRKGPHRLVPRVP